MVDAMLVPILDVRQALLRAGSHAFPQYVLTLPGLRILRTPSGHGLGTVYPSRAGSNELFGPLRAAFFPKIGDPAKLTR
jgi:hypothetical protein